MASYVVAAALFIIGSSYLTHFIVEPPGAATTGLAHLELESKAEDALSVILGTPGVGATDAAWDTSPTTIDSVKRLGIIEPGTSVRVDADKFDAIARGRVLTSSAGNGAVDYAEAKDALGLSNFEFHLRAYPVVAPSTTHPYGLSGFKDFRVAYVGDYAAGVAQPSAVAERDALDALDIDFTSTLRASSATGDVYKDDSVDVRNNLLPNIGALIQETVISQGSGTKYDFYRVNKTSYQGLTTANLSADLTSAMALSSDAATLGYTKNRELRAIVGKADLSLHDSAKLTWYEWVDTDRGNLSYDCGDYGYVEVSADDGETWTKLTDTSELRSQDCGTLPQLPHEPRLKERTVADITALCAACRRDPAVLIAFHWVADNDNSIGYGWVVDDVNLDVVGGPRLLRKTFEKPEYDMLIIGSGADHDAFTPNDVKEGIRDYVDKYGGRLMVTGPVANVQWLDRLFDAGTSPGGGGLSTPDVTHPLLTLPNQLAYSGYSRGNTWDLTNGDDAGLFSGIVTESNPNKHVLSVSRQAAWGSGGTGEGAVILSSYLPSTMPVEEAKKFFANGVAYGKFHYLYLEMGPPVPEREPVASVARTATMNMYRTGAANYTEMAFVMYVWPGASTATTFQSAAVHASAPYGVTAVAGDGEVTLTWKPPIANGSGSPGAFHIWRGHSPDATSESPLTTKAYPSPWVPTVTHAITGLTNGQTYYFNITLENSAGQGPGSAVVSATPMKLPTAPTNPTATSNQVGKIVVSWTPPSNEAPQTSGPGTIFGYRVYADETAPYDTFVLLSELGNVTQFHHSVSHTNEVHYKVQALNARGWSPDSAETFGRALEQVGPPTLSLTRGDGPNNITLTWVAPADFLGQTPAGYRIWRASAEAGPFAELVYLNSATNVSFKDANLGANVQRWYKVQAVTNFGDGQLSAAKTERTMLVPDAPTGLAASVPAPITGVSTITWSVPSSESPIVRYDVFRGTSADTGAMSFLHSATTAATTDVVPTGTTYWYAVKAVSAAGSSAHSNADSTAP